MRNPLLSRGLLAVLAVCLLTLLTLPIAGQRTDTEPAGARVPMFHDWTMRHVLYPQYGPVSAMLAAQHDPRAVQLGTPPRLPKTHWVAAST